MAQGFADRRMNSWEYPIVERIERRMDEAIARSNGRNAKIEILQYDLSSPGFEHLKAKYAAAGVRIEFGEAVGTALEELVFELKAVRIER